MTMARKAGGWALFLLAGFLLLLAFGGTTAILTTYRHADGYATLLYVVLPLVIVSILFIVAGRRLIK
jgi:hypothetical protein